MAGVVLISIIVAIVVGDWLYIEGGEVHLIINSEPVFGACQLLSQNRFRSEV